jgi:hypothetical protein
MLFNNYEINETRLFLRQAAVVEKALVIDLIIQ